MTQLNTKDEIDLSNLFRFGHAVKFPSDKRPGFLSHKHCPSLWSLGAKLFNSSDGSMSLIEEIITCANMVFDFLDIDVNDGKRSEKLAFLEKDRQSIYIRAYSELISYIRHLFIYYDNKISNEDLRQLIMSSNMWGWKTFFEKAANFYDKITVTTYNYDIWLERILSTMELGYNVFPFSNVPNCKFEIIKPHGSIDFVAKNDSKQMFSINYNVDLTPISIESIEQARNSYEEYAKSIIIPPAGDSLRNSPATWAGSLRLKAKEIASTMAEDDDVVICGMSYWHVDRRELDELLVNLHPKINVTLVNPSPPKDLNAVLLSLFDSYIVFTSSHMLGEMLND